MAEKCVDCRNFEKKEANAGLCRFNPPATHIELVSKNRTVWAIWPTVKPDDWCGKFILSSINHIKVAVYLVGGLAFRIFLRLTVGIR
jgi:hypothetical protein